MTIKETAGKVLLYFYQLQRTVPLTMRNRQLGFVDRKASGVFLTSDKKWLTENLQDINPATIDILNAIMFLINKGFILSRERETSEARIYVGIQLTAKGIDMVEGIEGDSDGKQAFTKTFNIHVGDNTDIDALIAENLRSLLE